MAVLEERGLFWWHEGALDENVLAPDGAVGGSCTIDTDGRIVLDLDIYLPNPHGPMAAMVGDIPKGRQIRGVLKGSGQGVLFIELVRNGGRFSSNGVSYERFTAMHCLIGARELFNGIGAPTFDTLDIPLTGFEEWLSFGSIELAKADGVFTATYREPPDVQWPFDGGSISIVFDAKSDVTGALAYHELSLKQTAALVLKFADRNDMEELGSQHGLVEDLFKLLTGSDYQMDWPWLSSGEGPRCRWYRRRLAADDVAEPPKYFETWTNFRQIREQFGSIWSTWRSKREEFGPGIYLYLGTRRGIKLYAEHRFVNLIWGVEAFHRKKHAGASTDALDAKVKRILDAVSAGDRRWLEGRLASAHEPPLSQRIFDVFSTLPIGLDEKRLRSFSDTCATLRNDISHFGGTRHQTPYTDFIQKLERHSTALSIFYHALLLHEVGVAPAIINRWIYEGPRPIKIDFVAAGLLDKSALPEGARDRTS